ncbi:unnamed protein product [Adineta ricciae]|uniref:F-box domain-containing protein n=1 Tax=Adineta ricciae TaxID=249248 RepID=A0A815NB35_ADIRI|nr:unnamed protein product [Adineta ricciae]
MNLSNSSSLNFLDLPNEILLLIFNKLNTVDVFYSLIDINDRFNQLLFSSLDISHLDMTTMSMESYYDCAFSIDDALLARIYKELSPRIPHELTQLIVEENSMEYILKNTTCPKLHSLSLVNFQEETLLQSLTGNSILRLLLAQQITHLTIDVPYDPQIESYEVLSNVFPLILSLCERLVYLNIAQVYSDRNAFISTDNLSPLNCVPTTLTTLKINVATFDDCLYLVEYLKSLSTLIVNAKKIALKLTNIRNTVNNN